MPVKAGQLGNVLKEKMPCAGTVSFESISRFIDSIEDFGEINPGYRGFMEMPENIVLCMSSYNSILGIMVLEPRDVNLIKVDIILIKENIRGKGLGKRMYHYLESALPDGTVLFVENYTFPGKKFFRKCGFIIDVDLIKVISPGNRFQTA